MPPPQQGHPSVPQQQVPATRPRQVVDLTNSDDERAPKRPRMTSDTNVYTHRSPGPVNHFQHQVYAQMPVSAPYQVLQQRNPQSGPQTAPMDQTQAQLTQQYYQQRTGANPMSSYQHVPSPTSSAYVGPYGMNALPNVPTPPTSASPAVDAYGVFSGERGAMHAQGLPSNGQMRAIGQPQQAYADPGYSVNVASPATDADSSHARSPTERSSGTPARPTSIVQTFPDSRPVSPRTGTNGSVHGGNITFPPLTEYQMGQMRSEVADSMFTEPEEGDETQARMCLLCK